MAGAGYRRIHITTVWKDIMGNEATWQEAITNNRFAGKTVIVTGAASGIGRATALRIAKEGGKIIAADISKEGLDVLVEENGGLDLEPAAGVGFLLSDVGTNVNGAILASDGGWSAL